MKMCEIYSRTLIYRLPLLVGSGSGPCELLLTVLSKAYVRFTIFPLPFSSFGWWWRWRLLSSDSGSSESITSMLIAIYFSKGSML